MNTNELATALEKQEQNLKNFLECSKKKQKAIIQNDIEKLHNSLSYEEKLLSEIEENNSNISSVIGNLVETYELNLSANSLSEFLSAVNNETEINVKVIKLLQNSIRELIGSSAKINEQNKILIEHSRNFLKETISLLVGLNKGPLLDRKV
jgi:lipopolysaccharide biosynthesis regulator YciM